MIMRAVDWVLCKLGKCRQCRWFETPAGIGGRCVSCGTLTGWMSNEELRKMLGIRTPEEERAVRDELAGAMVTMTGVVPERVTVTPPRAYLLKRPRGWQ